MNDKGFALLRQEIIDHESNQLHTAQGFLPLFSASADSRVVIVGQAPGIKAQTSGLVWNDASGVRLMSWLGVNEVQFRDPHIFAHIPMDFYYPGKGTSGDLPPRKDFARLWHTRLLDSMPNIELTILIGAHAQQYYLPNRERTLTETVQNYASYLPNHFPLIHPSPLNFRWFAKNPWFDTDVVPALRKRINEIINSSIDV